jgi:hypothetical protein
MSDARAEAPTTEGGHFKDEVLARLADSANVAQFVSFSPGHSPRVRHVALQALEQRTPQTIDEAVAALFERASSLNVRSFDPRQPKSNVFLYGLTEATDVLREVERLAADGLFTIVNETIDVHDGGVSGVCVGDVIEFAPNDTPRCVEKPGTAAFPREMGLRILETVYGFRPNLDRYPNDVRVEFSIHPLRRGVRHDHTIVWEEERVGNLTLDVAVAWPNRFSRFIGDKAFGLLVADVLGLRVPATTVFARALAPFRFGQRTGTNEPWVRTSPVEQAPGRFTTKHGWIDPYRLLSLEDPDGTVIASVIVQEGIDAMWSGATLPATGNEVIIEGVRGTGEAFMLGKAAPDQMPQGVVADVKQLQRQATAALGTVRLEWVHDGAQAWVVQMHRPETVVESGVIFPGKPLRQHRFNVEQGLEALRQLAERLRGTGEGIVLVGAIGVTSHYGDILRRAQIPSRLERPAASHVEQLFEPTQAE